MNAFTNLLRQNFASTYLLTLFFSSAGVSENLQDIYEIAVAQDPVIAAARATYRANAETRTQSKAALLPSLSATGSYSDSTYKVSDLQSFFVQDNRTETDLKRYSLSLTQSLFDLPAWFRFQQGKDLSNSAKAQFAADQQDLIHQNF